MDDHKKEMLGRAIGSATAVAMGIVMMYGGTRMAVFGSHFAVAGVKGLIRRAK